MNNENLVENQEQSEEKKSISRKKFLVNSSKLAIGAAVGVAGLSMLKGNEVHAETKDVQYTWPYPYITLDPEVVRQNAHALYWNGKDCCAGVFGGICQSLSTGIGAPWSDFPIEVMLFGRGGGVSWGSLCGALNGGAALISLVVGKDPSVPLINELWGWYTTQNLPSNAANAATYVDHPEIGTLVQNIAGSPLCHQSVSLWCTIANKTVPSTERKERCARIAGDIAAKTVEILNAYFASTFVGTFTDPASNASCLTCHGAGSSQNNVNTHMECVTCHKDNTPHSTGIAALGGAAGYELSNAYPNPFNSSTTIKFSIPANERVRLEIYDIKGKLVRSLIDSEEIYGGTYEVTWNRTNNAGYEVANGIYLGKITTGNFMKSIRINVMK